MPKYILRKGERAQAFQGSRVEQRGCCPVTIYERIMFVDDCVVDTGDTSMQSWVDLGMLEPVDDNQAIDLISDGYSIPIRDSEFIKIESVVIGDTGIADVTTVVVGVDGNEITNDDDEVKTEQIVENKEPEVKSFDIVEEATKEFIPESPKTIRKQKRK
jgi:hypothetical protein